MATRSDDQLLILAGTSEGLYLYEGTCARAGWAVRGPYLAGCDIANAVLDPRDGRTIWVAASGNGSTAVYRSPDRGHHPPSVRSTKASPDRRQLHALRLSRH